MIFKDKETLAWLKTIDRKLDIIIAMKRNDKIKQAASKCKIVDKGDEI